MRKHEISQYCRGSHTQSPYLSFFTSHSARLFSLILCLSLLPAMAGCSRQREELPPETETWSDLSETVSETESSGEVPAPEALPPWEKEASEEIPEYWMKPLETGAQEIREAVQQAGRNRSSFLFYTDSHWTYSSRMSPRLLKYLHEYTPLNKVIFGGDIVQNEPAGTDPEDFKLMNYLWRWRKEIRDLKHYSVVGNHDDGQDTNNLFSFEYVYTYLFAPEDSDEIVRGGYTYYYFDDAAEKTRYLCLDTAYEGIYNMSAEQVAFLTDSLISTPEGWHIIVAAHAWFTPDYDNFVKEEPIPILGLTAHAATAAEILDQYNARTGPFQDCGGKVEFCVGGHAHRDYAGATPGGIPIILCESDSEQVRGGMPCELGTETEAAVSGFIADYDHNTLYIIRVGRGSNFEVPLGPSPESATVTAGQYTNMLDTVGFTSGHRVSGASGNPTLCANTDLTGLIPVTKGDIIRLKNITMPDTKDNYFSVVAYYQEDQTFLRADYIHSTKEECSPVYDESGNLIQFTIYEDAAFIRICADQILENAIVTVNEPIA